MMKKMPSPRESFLSLTSFIKAANDAIENNTDERIIRIYR